MESMSANLRIILGALEKAGRPLLRDFGEIEQLQGSARGAEKFAASAMVRAESTLAAELSEARPKYGITTPSADRKGSDISHRFLVNPLSGLAAFSRGVPLFALSVALLEQGEVVAGAIYNPILDKLFYAEKGGGAFVKEARMTRRIRAGKRREDPFRLGLGCVPLELAYTAAGCLDGCSVRQAGEFETAAGLLIMREAGATLEEK